MSSSSSSSTASEAAAPGAAASAAGSNRTTATTTTNNNTTTPSATTTNNTTTTTTTTTTISSTTTMQYASHLCSQGRAFWQSQNYVEALSRFGQAVRLLEVQLSPFHPLVAKTYYWIGFIYKHSISSSTVGSTVGSEGDEDDTTTTRTAVDVQYLLLALHAFTKSARIRLSLPDKKKNTTTTSTTNSTTTNDDDNTTTTQDNNNKPLQEAKQAIQWVLRALQERCGQRSDDNDNDNDNTNKTEPQDLHNASFSSQHSTAIVHLTTTTWQQFQSFQELILHKDERRRGGGGGGVVAAAGSEGSTAGVDNNIKDNNNNHYSSSSSSSTCRYWTALQDSIRLEAKADACLQKSKNKQHDNNNNNNNNTTTTTQIVEPALELYQASWECFPDPQHASLWGKMAFCHAQLASSTTTQQQQQQQQQQQPDDSDYHLQQAVYHYRQALKLFRASHTMKLQVLLDDAAGGNTSSSSSKNAVLLQSSLLSQIYGPATTTTTTTKGSNSSNANATVLQLDPHPDTNTTLQRLLQVITQNNSSSNNSASSRVVTFRSSSSDRDREQQRDLQKRLSKSMVQSIQFEHAGDEWLWQYQWQQQQQLQLGGGSTTGNTSSLSSTLLSKAQQRYHQALNVLISTSFSSSGNNNNNNNNTTNATINWKDLVVSTLQRSMEEINNLQDDDDASAAAAGNGNDTRSKMATKTSKRSLSASSLSPIKAMTAATATAEVEQQQQPTVQLDEDVSMSSFAENASLSASSLHSPYHHSRTTTVAMPEQMDSQEFHVLATAATNTTTTTTTTLPATEKEEATSSSSELGVVVVEQYKQQISRLVQQSSSLRETISKQDQTIQQLQQEQSLQSKAKPPYPDTKTTATKRDVDATTFAATNLHAVVKELTASKADVESSLLLSKQQISKLAREKKALSIELEDVQSKATKTELQWKRTESELALVESRLKVSTKQLEASSQERTALYDQRVVELEEALAAAKVQVQESNAKLSSLEASHSSAKGHHEELKSLHEDNLERLERAMARVQELETVLPTVGDNNAPQTALKEVESQRDTAAIQEVDDLKQQLARLKESHAKDLASMVQETRKERDAVKQDLINLQKEHQKLQSEVATSRKAAASSAASTTTSTTAGSGSMNSKTLELETKHAAETRVFRDLASQAEAKLESYRLDVSSALQTLTAEIATLLQRESSVPAEVSVVKSSFDLDDGDDVMRLPSSGMMTKHQETFEEIQGMLHSLREERSHAYTKLTKLKAQNEAAAQMMQRISSQLKSKNNKYKTIRKQVVKLQTMHTAMDTNVRTLQESVAATAGNNSTAKSLQPTLEELQKHLTAVMELVAMSTSSRSSQNSTGSLFSSDDTLETKDIMMPFVTIGDRGGTAVEATSTSRGMGGEESKSVVVRAATQVSPFNETLAAQYVIRDMVLSQTLDPKSLWGKWCRSLGSDATPQDLYVRSVRANDPSTLEIMAQLRNRGESNNKSLFYLRGTANVMIYNATSREWTNYGNVDERDEPLGWAISDKGHDGCSLDEVLEEALLYREEYCRRLHHQVQLIQLPDWERLLWEAKSKCVDSKAARAFWIVAVHVAIVLHFSKWILSIMF